jgi:DNA-directed RNA polymerase subunit RPC12/RpoP
MFLPSEGGERVLESEGSMSESPQQQRSLTGESVSERELAESREVRGDDVNDDGELECPECGHTTFWVAGPTSKKVSLNADETIKDVHKTQPMDVTTKRCANCNHEF